MQAQLVIFFDIDNYEFSVFDGANYCGGVVVHDRWDK